MKHDCLDGCDVNPKGTDFSTLTDEFNRPRKSLRYLTPLEYFKEMYNFTPDSAVALSN